MPVLSLSPTRSDEQDGGGEEEESEGRSEDGLFENGEGNDGNNNATAGSDGMTMAADASSSLLHELVSEVHTTYASSENDEHIEHLDGM